MLEDSLWQIDILYPPRTVIKEVAEDLPLTPGQLAWETYHSHSHKFVLIHGYILLRIYFGLVLDWRHFMQNTTPWPYLAWRYYLIVYGIVWARLHGPVVCVRARDVMFLLLHDKLPVVERLFRIRVRNDPYCQSCVGAEIADVEHFFCLCEKVRRVWVWVRNEVMKHVGQQQDASDWELLNLFLPRECLAG